MSSARHYIIQSFLAIVVVFVGCLVFMKFFGDKQTAKRGERIDRGVLVEVVSYQKATHEIQLEATGEVEASRTMNLKSEASGRVTYVSDKFFPGAHLKKGDVIAKISTEDYKLKLTQAKITLSQRESALVQEKAKGRAAEAELKALQKTILNGKELTSEQEALIRRDPQLQEAMASVELAKISVQQAQLDYDRSVIKMPYDAVVQTINISQGDYISGATTLGTVVADDQVWVKVSLQPSLIAWTGATEEMFGKINASVTYDIGGQTIERKARVLSMLGQVESLGRMVQIVLAVDNPFGEPVNAPLLIGTFVHAKLNAPTTLESIELPRAYVREGNQVYVCNSENKLEIRDIVTPYKTSDNVYVTEGLNSGERVVTTLISSPINGRKLRVDGETPPEGDRGMGERGERPKREGGGERPNRDGERPNRGERPAGGPPQ